MTTVIQLANGLSLVHSLHGSAGAGIFGIAVRAGSADETPDKWGLAHLVEHTIFKGTAKLKSWQIINRMEAVGGELNAFTTKEETVVYSIFPGQYTQRAVALIAELALNSEFPEAELEKEREVVIDEINSYRDIPAEAIYDDYEEYVFGDSPLAHNILGTPESVRELGSLDCREFINRYYRADNMVAFYSGSDAPEKVARLVEKFFAGITPSVGNRRIIETPVFNRPGKTVHLDTHQTHVLTGTCVEGLASPQRYAVSLFSNIIGGPGMNSLLNVELREKRGLVYTVEASTAMFTPCGLLTVYFGCDASDLEKCLKVCRHVFENIAAGKLTDNRLAKAKRQYLGQLSIASENRENRIMSAARSVLFRGYTSTLEETGREIDSVTLTQIENLAAAMLDGSSLIFTN